jgi:hypothetical protein
VETVAQVPKMAHVTTLRGMPLTVYSEIPLLTPCTRVILQKKIVARLVKKFPTFYATHIHITD